MTHFVNVSGRTQTQPDGQDWAPLAAFEWPEESVAHLIAYHYVLPLAAPTPEAAVPDPAPSPEAVAEEQASPPEAPAPETAPPPREAAISSAPRKRSTPPKEDSQ